MTALWRCPPHEETSTGENDSARLQGLHLGMLHPLPRAALRHLLSLTVTRLVSLTLLVVFATACAENGGAEAPILHVSFSGG